MATRTLRLGVLGLRFPHADWFLNELDGLDVELVGIAEPDAATREQLRRWNVPVLAGYEELLAQGLDLALVSPINAERGPVIELAASRGVHVVVDKPAVTDEGQLDGIAAAVSRAGVQLAMLMTERFTARYGALKRELDAGALGRVASYVAVRPYSFLAELPAWYQDAALTGGPLVDLMIHDFDLLRWLHPAEPVAVTAHLHAVSPEGGPPAPDSATALVRFADGATALLTTNWLAPTRDQMYGELTVFGERGSAWTPSVKLTQLPVAVQQTLGMESHDAVAFVRPDGSVDWVQEEGGYMRALTTDLVGALRDGSRPLVATEDVLGAMRLALAARRSAEEGRTVEL